MSFLMILAHGATGTWLDEFVELGLPLLILVGLYFGITYAFPTKLGGKHLKSMLPFVLLQGALP